eukprot:scaffold2701_cov96-Isochrysis_galbana.AAC.3
MASKTRWGPKVAVPCARAAAWSAGAPGCSGAGGRCGKSRITAGEPLRRARLAASMHDCEPG